MGNTRFIVGRNLLKNKFTVDKKKGLEQMRNLKQTLGRGWINCENERRDEAKKWENQKE